MNRKRAIWVSVLAYLASFVVGLIAAYIIGNDVFSGDPITLQQWILSIVLSIVVIYFFTLWYFKDENIKPSPKEGFYFGLTLFIVGWVLDSAIVIPTLLLSDSPINILEYYADPLFWVAILFIFATTIFVGYWKSRK